MSGQRPIRIGTLRICTVWLKCIIYIQPIANSCVLCVPEKIPVKVIKHLLSISSMSSLVKYANATVIINFLFKLSHKNALMCFKLEVSTILFL